MKTMTAVRRVNLGSGKYPLEDWTNVDLFEPAEIQGDFREIKFENLDEVRMCHVLEHVSWRETVPLLTAIRSWMKPAGMLTVEVPDMHRIMELGTKHPLWFKYVYGDQSHEGEYHLAGFTWTELGVKLREAGWNDILIKLFDSDHPGRVGMPCMEAKAFA